MTFIRLFFCVTLLSSAALAENGGGLPAAKAEVSKVADAGKVGRLPDGRAYRVDKDGFQIVDHIAELEATVDSLNRQVNSLEDQIEDEVEIELEDENLTEPFPPRKKPHPSQVITPSQMKRVGGPDCSLEISSMRRKIAALEKGLVQSRKTALLSLARDNEVGELEAQVARLQNALMARPSSERLTKEISGLESDIVSRENLLNNEREKAQRLHQGLIERASSAEEKLEEVSQLLAKKQSNEKALRAELENLTGQVTSLRNELNSGSARVASAPTTRSRLKRPTRARATDGFDQRSVNAASREFKRRLFKVEALMLERDRVFRIAKSGRPIKISRSDLETSAGDSFSDLRSDILGIHSGSDIPGIRSGIAQLERILLQDIEHARRVSRSR